jgi:hypothetical protein
MKKNFILFYLLILSVFITSAQCPAGQNQVIVSITPDNYPAEITWDIRNNMTNVVVASGNYLSDTVCLPNNSCFRFTIYDSAGDGICCGYGNGSYSIYVNGNLTATGGQYTSQQSVYFTCPPGTSCESAIAVNTGSYTAPVSNTWYEFVPDSTGSYTISTCGATCDTKIWVYDECANLIWNFTNNQGTVYYNDDNTTCNLQAVIDAVLSAGQTYYIRIGQYNTSCGSNPINWSVTFNGPIVGCTDPQACNYNPMATVSDGSCVYEPSPLCPRPDLMILQSAIQNSLQMDQVDAQNCYVNEGCLNGYGLRDVLRFTTHIKNIGTADYYIGNPTTSPVGQFTFDNCHNHWHYSGYAQYLLYDTAGNALPIGFKNGFCVLDLECSGGGTAQYGCSNMGISHGCGDIYGSGLACQWIDITDVDTGKYMLVVKVNWDQSPDANGHQEITYDNNWAQVCIRLTMDALGNKNFVIDQNCVPYVDCMGVTYGNAVYDCNGICDGPAMMGDLMDNDSIEQVDAVMYVDSLLNHTIQPTNCWDMNDDNEVTVFDAAIVNNCAANGPSQVNDPCEFPFGIDNIMDTVTLSIQTVNFSQQYLDIYIRNPNNKQVAYQFKLRGVHATVVQNLVNPLEYSITPQVDNAGQEIIGISYQQMLIDKNLNPDALCRVYFNAITDTLICIENIIDVVNENYEAAYTQIEGNCFVTPLSSSYDELLSDLNISLYPNPVNDFLTISTQEHVISRMQVLDANGKVVMTYPGMINGTINVDLSLLSKGVYHIQLEGDEFKLTRKVVKM